MMSVMENYNKQFTKAVTTEIWLEVTKGQSDGAFLSKGK